MDIVRSFSSDFKSKFSQVISLLRLPLAIFIVYYHCRPATIRNDVDMYPISSFLDFLDVHIVGGGIVVPLFFLISGYLFFNKSPFTGDVYKDKIIKRIKTLLVPYLLWNLGLVLLHFVIQQTIPSAGASAKYPIASWNFYNWIGAFWSMRMIDPNLTNTPLDGPLWFIRDLIVVSIASPIIYHFVKKSRGVGMLALMLFYIFNQTELMFLHAVIFFSIGAYISEIKDNIPAKSIKTNLCILIYSCWLLVIYYLRDTDAYEYIFRINVFFTIIVIYLFSMNYISTHKIIDHSKALTGAVFAIYAMHIEFSTFLQKAYETGFLLNNDIMTSLTFIVAPMLIVLLITIISAFVKYLNPKYYSIITGGR